MIPRFEPHRSSVSAPPRRRLPTVWITMAALFAGLCLMVGIFFTSTMGEQVLSTLRFAFGWYEIPQKQQQLRNALEDILHQAGLDEKAYRLERLQPQQRGREYWQLLRHRIVIPADLSLATFEQHLQTRLADLPHAIMVRRSREQNRHQSVAFTLGVANVPTDICIFTQMHPPLKTPATPLQPEPLAMPHVAPKRDLDAVAAPRIAIVIDDMGWELPIAQELLALEHPLSFAILPQAPYQFEITEAAKLHQRDLLLHLPMEPHGYPQVNPGPNTLLSSMAPDQMLTLVRSALQSLPQVVGVNNHMGSSLTENPQAMRVVMRELKQRDLFFLDSRTSIDSQAYQIAREMGIPTAKRHVFLDNDVHPTQISAQLHRLAEMASRQGYAIGIGHPYPETLHALQQTLPTIRQAGIQIVPISHLVN